MNTFYLLSILLALFLSRSLLWEEVEIPMFLFSCLGCLFLFMVFQKKYPLVMKAIKFKQKFVNESAFIELRKEWKLIAWQNLLMTKITPKLATVGSCALNVLLKDRLKDR